MLVALLAAGVASCASAQAINFEWAGIFPTSENKYLWTAQKVKQSDGTIRYADATMKLAALPASSATKAALQSLETEGIQALGETCIELDAGVGRASIVPELDKCWKLRFDASVWQSLFTVDTSNTPAVAFFAEHVPTEFENTAHYLKDDHGDDIEPGAELPEAADTDEDHWGAAIAASIIVNFITLIPVVLAVPVIKKVVDSYGAELIAIFSGFAGGAIIACAFFLLLFESTHLVATGWTEEVDVLWRWGTMILAGFALPAFVDIMISAVKEKMFPEAPYKGAEANDAEASKPNPNNVPPLLQSTRVRIIAGVLLGDFFHNLCDGFFIAAAFKGCGNSFGWGVALSTVLHELPQEFADYMILTGPGVHLWPIAALVWNFVSGLSVILGAIIVMASDVDNKDIGLLLAFGGGTYLHIAATECMPRIYNEQLSLRVRAAALLAFVVGTVLIGLILLDHEHCVPSEGGGHHH